ncbi:D-alanyl-D-alanine carboxypeptidase family protein [Streptomyces sp. NBC_00094]|uniref:D-alanyl-D-alanine carboxypeptidase family protein n=1 Tax=Streptomyces sp. NBC_00094 TaxID=2903620 RepID=UPI00225B5365|nr:D-alanyl-D-alanine carboxypeptidase family protein [Streptomyces sp. NBC_00094]MCX5394791.1 D-alanyl-D-alanine carboxypeptidase family protein [Streptomyces sp. NBC_00094]
MSTYECECGGGHHRPAAEPGRAGGAGAELGEFTAETGLLGDEYGSPLSEAEERALATELLGVTDERELEAFLGSFLAPIARRDGGFLSSAAGETLGGVLKNVARTALPLLPPGAGPGTGTGATGPGERTVQRVAMLRRHAGTPPDLFLRWNAMDRPSRIDVVVHLHGFSPSGRHMRLPGNTAKVSGLDLGGPPSTGRPGRTTPTLLVLPRGHWFGGRSGRGYTHPALERPGAVRRLANQALALFAATTGVRAPLGRLVLTAHSGGGASLMRLVQETDPDEVHTFDALYGDPGPLIAWARQRIARGTGALRVLYRPYEPTARHSEQVAAALASTASPRFRVEWTTAPHMDIPRLYGPPLLTDVAADLPGAALAPAPPRPLRKRRSPAVRELAEEGADEPESETGSGGGGGGGWSGTPDQLAFRQRVLDAHLARTRARKGKPGRDLAPEELTSVPGTSIAMRSDAAEAAGRLLAAARRALAAAQTTGQEDAARTVRLTGGSGYRGRAHQQRLWLGYFRRYYSQSADARAGLPGGPHGDAAVRYMLDVFGIPSRIAAPGYSNHQNGIAIDFLQMRGRGQAIANSTGARAVARWRATWFFGWLTTHAHRFGFVPYAKEPWHWIYRGSGAAPSVSSGSPGRTEPRPRPYLENPAAGELFGVDTELLGPQEGEFEIARRFVRLSAAAARNAAMAPRDRYRHYRPYRGRAGDRAVGRAAVFAAARRHAPGLYRSFPRYARPAPWYWPRPVRAVRRPWRGRPSNAWPTPPPYAPAPYAPERYPAYRPPFQEPEPDPYAPASTPPAPYEPTPYAPEPAAGDPAEPSSSPSTAAEPAADEPTAGAPTDTPPTEPSAGPSTTPSAAPSGGPSAAPSGGPSAALSGGPSGAEVATAHGRSTGTWVRRGNRVMILEA